ncbi:hypothetical protein CHARACLAT_019644 [Characodon lateralis]|uniref:Prolactin receptor n=1 Tax=Characodon lateralis TaxID=208331 RepID=A0ABU7DVN0_9TELE|nr:hypothetical protein [Characodon lateralis]
MNNMVMSSHHTVQKEDGFCVPEINVSGAKCVNQPQNKNRNLVKMLAEPGKRGIIHSETSPDLDQHGLKGHSAKKKQLLQNQHKKPDYTLQMHSGKKTLIFAYMRSIGNC